MNEDELADEVEQLVLKTHGPAKFIPIHAKWIDVAGVVLAEGPVTPDPTMENTFDVLTEADYTGTFSHLLLTDGNGHVSSADVRLNTNSICTGAIIQSKITITYD